MTSPSPVRPTATAPHCLAVADQWIADRIAADRVPDPHRLILGARDDDVAVPGPADRHGVYLPEAGQALVSSAGPVLRFATPAAAQPGSPAAAGLVPGHPGLRLSAGLTTRGRENALNRGEVHLTSQNAICLGSRSG